MGISIYEVYCVCSNGDLDGYVVYTDKDEAEVACAEKNKMLKEHYPVLPLYTVQTLDDHMCDIRTSALDDCTISEYYRY